MNVIDHMLADVRWEMQIFSMDRPRAVLVDALIG
jgi:hypothetical protein